MAFTTAGFLEMMVSSSPTAHVLTSWDLKNVLHVATVLQQKG